MRIKVTALILSAMLLSGCTAESGREVPETQSLPAEDSGVAEAISTEYFSHRDFETDYDESSAVIIKLNGDSVVCESSLVEISGSTATIKDEGCYVLSGELSDGMLKIDAENTDKVQLVLAGAKIHSKSSAAIYVLQADKVFLTLAEDSENELSNGGSFIAIDENNIDAVIFSKDDLTLNGSGSLSVSSPGGHGVVSKDSLTLSGGSYDISAASNGLKGSDDVSIAGGSLAISSGKDAIQAENDEDESSGFVYIQGGNFDISAEGDGISASAWMQIDGGTFRVTAGGGSENAAEKSSGTWGQFMGGSHRGDMGRPGIGRGAGRFMTAPEIPEGMDIPEKPEDGMEVTGMHEAMRPPEPPVENFEAAEAVSGDGSSMKGFKANGELRINGGSFTMDCADDTFHSDADLTVNDGVFEISSGDDAFHAENELIINGGRINIAESYEGLEALHLSIAGGDITVNASDDGLNAAGGVDMSGAGGRDGMFGGSMNFNSDGSIRISGGNLNITAYGDGLDANGCVEIRGGNTVVCGPAFGDTAILDYYSTAAISGGSFIGSGGAMMAQSFSEASQGAVCEEFDCTLPAGTMMQLLDSDGNMVLSLSPELEFNLIIISVPELSADGSYRLSVETE